MNNKFEIINIGGFRMIKEEHVGGCLIEKDPATFMPELWNYLIDDLNIKTIIDVGCGMGHFVNFVKYKVDYAIGIDGSQYVIENSPYKNDIIYHDFTKSKYEPTQNFDLGWCCEFVEHVDEKYIDNFMNIFKKCKYIAATYAGPGQDGHNHVNCKPLEYWVNIFSKYNLIYDDEKTKSLKKITISDALKINPNFKDNHFMNRGMFFKNENL
jgi:SAM-dependent methyltransferase